LKKTSKLVVVLAAASLTVGGVAMAPASHAAKIKACIALDTGGVDDKSFNASAWAGAQAASSVASVEYLASTSDADYAPNIKKFVDKKCDIIVGVGFLINGAIVDAAKKNPTIKFAIVDQDGLDHGADGSVYPGTALKNLKALTFATDQSSFQAGYLAAGYSKSGKVATFGGMNFASVSIFMDGFAKGVAYYNTQNKTKVQVLGWDTAKKDGTFVGNFSDQAKALQISKNFEQQGADVIFPVAGGLGAATAQNAMAGGKSVVIWVDSDGYIAANQYHSVLLTSVVKGVGESVTQVIKDVAKGKYSNTAYVGTLANKGTMLAPYHDFATKVSARLQLGVKIVGNNIRSGALKI
jgi:basic membrane protein A